MFYVYGRGVNGTGHMNNVLYLVECAKWAPSADNSQPFSFRVFGQGFDVFYDEKRVGKSTFSESDPATLLSLGALLENIRQGAEFANVDIKIAAREKRVDRLGASALLSVYVREEVNIKSGIKPALFLRHTNRSNYDAISPVDEGLQGLTQRFRNYARAHWLQLDQRSIMGKMQRRASEVRFQTRQVQEWLSHSQKFSADEIANGDGLDVATLALPLSGAQFLKFISPWPRMAFLNRFGAFRALAAIDAAPVFSAPRLVGIVSSIDEDAVVEAGELMEELWIALNQRGLAVHPYYAVPDQLNRLRAGTVPKGLCATVKKIKSGSEKLFGLSEGEQLQMLFRVGFPQSQPRRSRRLPSKVLITKNDGVSQGS